MVYISQYIQKDPSLLDLPEDFHTQPGCMFLGHLYLHLDHHHPQVLVWEQVIITIIMVAIIMMPVAQVLVIHHSY